MLPVRPPLFALLAAFSLAAPPAAADVLDEANRPLPPTALLVQAGPDGNMLSWQPPLANPGAPLETYNVYRVVDGTQALLDSVDAATTTYHDGDVPPPGSTTTYYVTARSADGESAPSNLAVPYPHCFDVVGLHPLEVKPECVWPVPAGPAVNSRHLIRNLLT